jgi:ribose transport system substrate-binding protein
MASASKESGSSWSVRVLLAGAVGAMIVSAPIVARAADSELPDAIKAVTGDTGPQTEWTGPTTGPKAPPGKNIVFVSCGAFNQICVSVGKSVAEASNKIGWKVTIIDGKGNASGWLSAWNQALALKPDGIISFVSADAVQAPIQEAKTMGIPVVGVLAASTPGPQPELGLFTNVSQDPASIGTAEAQYAIAKSNGTARAVIVYDTLYAIARYKAEAMKKELEKCSGCKILDYRTTPAAELQQNSGQLISSWVEKYGSEPIWILTVGDVFADFMAPPLRAGGVKPSEVMIVAADGFPTAYDRIRKGDYQVATVPQPQSELAYQAVNELVRAMAGQPPSGYSPDVYIVDKSDVDLYGGDKNQFVPANDFAQRYLGIWTGK